MDIITLLENETPAGRNVLLRELNDKDLDELMRELHISIAGEYTRENKIYAIAGWFNV